MIFYQVFSRKYLIANIEFPRRICSSRVNLSIKSAIIFSFLLSSVLLAQESPQTSSPSEPTSSQIIQFLGETIDWYRQTQQEQHIATDPGDLGFAADNRRMADQIVRLSFDFARQQEQQMAKQSKAPPPNPTDMGSRYESISRNAARADALVQQTQEELQSLKDKLETTPASKRKQLQTQIEETQSELGLFLVRQQALHSLLDFAGGASKGGGTSPRAQIEELARAVPAAISGTGANENAASTDNQQPVKVKEVAAKSPPTGMWGLASDLLRLSSKRSLLAGNLRATRQLEDTAKQLRTPLVNHLKQLIQTGDQLTQQADTSDQNGLLQEKQQLDRLTAQFKQVSGLLSSLGKQSILFDLYKRSLSNWQAEVVSDLKERSKGIVSPAVRPGHRLGGGFSGRGVLAAGDLSLRS